MTTFLRVLLAVGLLGSTSTGHAEPAPDLTTEGVVRTGLRLGYSATTLFQTQTITATTPSLGTICVALARYGPPPPVSLTVQADVDGATPLVVQALTLPPLSPDFRAPSWACGSFAPAIPTSVGHRYRITLTVATPSTRSFLYWAGDTGDPYAGGALFGGSPRIDAALRGYAEPVGSPPEPDPDPQGPPPPGLVDGCGADTRGGEGQPIYRVTTLADSGPGSLRDALSQGNRYIVFDVGGTIATTSDYLWVRGANLTIDGATAPAPGITITGRGPVIWGSRGAHDVIVTHIKRRSPIAANDGIGIGAGTFNIVLDHLSVTGSPDGNVDIGQTAVHNVTVANSLIYRATGEGKNSLVAYRPQCISYVGNLLAGIQRNPQVRFDDNGAVSPGLTMDLVNNLIAAETVGVWARWGVKLNVLANYFLPNASKPLNAFTVNGPSAFVHVAENLSALTSYDPNAPSNYARSNDGVTIMSTPFLPTAARIDAWLAACRILATAGAQHRDAADLAIVAEMRSKVTPACPQP
jgi:hypothetical protein